MGKKGQVPAQAPDEAPAPAKKKREWFNGTPGDISTKLYPVITKPYQIKPMVQFAPGQELDPKQTISGKGAGGLGRGSGGGLGA